MIRRLQHPQKRKQWGFTLLELLIVVAILATLMAIAVPSMVYYIDKIRNQEALLDLRNISLDITLYYHEHNAYPNSLADIGRGAFQDPWGNPYRYLRIDGGDAHGKGAYRKDRNLVPVNTDFDLYSMGKDGKSQPPFTAEASWDDIVRCNNGSYYGLASNY